jgi:hypothetical protein
MRASNWRTTALAATAFLLGTIAAGSGTLRAAWEPIARFIRLEDPPKPASANVLSEHEIAVLDEMPPQSQAELQRPDGACGGHRSGYRGEEPHDRLLYC